MGKLTGRYAAVTGAARGIGYAIVERFLEDDVAGVALLDLNEEQAKAAALALDPTGKKVLPVACDVSDQESVHAAFQTIEAAFGRVDILVNNAGITRDAMFHKMKPEHAHQVMNVHFFGTFYCCQEVITGMRERAYGKIVNISSVSSFGNVGQTNYSAAKAAIDGFTRSLALESARKNITVNSIMPGMINTDMLKSQPADILQMKIDALPMQRVGEPSELAAVVSFLACDDSSFVTGNTIIVCGGQKTRA
jgi:3-oxoacyl-[acyl-carrier protein] reductase